MPSGGLAVPLIAILAATTPSWAETATLPREVHSPDTPFRQAVDYCRDHAGQIRLNEDQTIACFDGGIGENRDLAPILNLAEGGLFAIRSRGGDPYVAMGIADALHDRNATVVVYDYCASACASFILIATATTFVAKGSVVAWHAPCNGGSEKHATWAMLEARCSTHPVLSDTFFDRRRIDRQARKFASTPQSPHLRKMVRMMYDGSAAHRDLFWTWHPRHYARYFTTKVIYEAYPESPDEVDAVARRFGLGHIIHDP